MSKWTYDDFPRMMSCPINEIVYPLPLVRGQEIKITPGGPWVMIAETGVARDEADLRRKVRQWEQIDGPTEPVRKRDNT